MLYETIKSLCKKKGVTISQLERELDFAKGSISKIDRHKPSADKIHRIAEYFGIGYNQLISKAYYENEDVQEYTIFLKNNPEYRVLFDASRKVKPQDIALVKALIERFADGDDT